MNRSAARLESCASWVRTSAILLFAFCLVANAHTAVAADAKFVALTAKTTSVRVGHAATLLPNGEVLLTGGCGNSCFTSDTALNTAEVYDPVANKFTALSATMTSGRFGLTATLLPNGLVLITGGTDSTGDGPTLNSAELYDPVKEKFSAIPATMISDRFAHTATRLPDGRVLITGGFSDESAFPNYDTNSAEIYDPVANIFSAVTATMTVPRANHTATLLPNGLVLLTGGIDGLNTAELYDPVKEQFSALAAAMTSIRDGHTATLLPNGQVVLTGGTNVPHAATTLNTAEVYDPAVNVFTALSAAMTTGRWSHTATLLPNGQVLLTGGASGTKPSPVGLNTAELYTSGPANTATATATATPTPTPTPTGLPPCVGDCNGNGSVTIDEILTLVNSALGTTPVTTCEAGDANHDNKITVDEILTAVNNALNGCTEG